MEARRLPAPVSTRFPVHTVAQLERRSREDGGTRSELIQRYVVEGLAMDEFPGIVFRSGPAGRRPGIAGGPDVWEVVAVERSFADAARTAEWLEQPLSAVETALAFYQANQADIDEWILRNEEAAAAAERVWRARQAAS